MPARQVRIRKHDLAIALQKINPHPSPKVALEQYTIPADLAAEVLFTACYTFNDIHGKEIVDLGSGTGRLSLGASILGADYVVGIDVDRSSLAIARAAKKSVNAQVDFVLGQIQTICGSVDTVLMNPPFGTKTAHADLEFLQCALQLGRVVYSIHKSSTREFLKRWLMKRGFSYDRVLESQMEIPHQFSFHRKQRGSVAVDVIRITKR